MVNAISTPWQFSCWNKMEWKDINIKNGKGSEWDDSEHIADMMVSGMFSPVSDFDHYYNPNKANPSWAYTDKSKTQRRPFKQIGNHRFLNLGNWVLKGTI